MTDDEALNEMEKELQINTPDSQVRPPSVRLVRVVYTLFKHFRKHGYLQEHHQPSER